MRQMQTNSAFCFFKYFECSYFCLSKNLYVFGSVDSAFFIAISSCWTRYSIGLKDVVCICNVNLK